MSAFERKVAVVNLDPANETLAYDCAINIMELVKLDDVMEVEQLGPNGGILYAMEYLEQNFDWLQTKIEQIECKD